MSFQTIQALFAQWNEYYGLHSQGTVPYRIILYYITRQTSPLFKEITHVRGRSHTILILITA